MGNKLVPQYGEGYGIDGQIFLGSGQRIRQTLRSHNETFDNDLAFMTETPREFDIMIFLMLH